MREIAIENIANAILSMQGRVSIPEQKRLIKKVLGECMAHPEIAEKVWAAPEFDILKSVPKPKE